MGEHGGEFRRGEQVERADAHHDLGADARQAVGRRRRVVHHERAGNLGIAVREQGEQLALPAPRRHRVGERHDEHPAERGEQREPGDERDQPDGREHQRLMRREGLAVGQPPGERGQPAEHARARSLTADADGKQRADGCEAAGQAKCLPQQNRGRRGPARPGRAQHRACAAHAPHGDRGEKYRVGQCPHNPTPLSPSVSSSWCSRSSPDRASRSTSASAPDTLCANLASAASRSPVCASAVSISSATYASRVAAGRYRQARPSRSLRANPFFASRSSTVITVV